MNEIPQSCAALEKWDSPTPPSKEDIQKCVKDIERQGFRPGITVIPELKYDKNNAVLRERPPETPKTFFQKVNDVAGYASRITNYLKSIKVGDSTVGDCLGKVGKKLDAADIIVRRTAPTIDSAIESYKSGDTTYNGAAWNLCQDIPMTFIESSDNVVNLGSNVLLKFLPKSIQEKIKNSKYGGKFLKDGITGAAEKGIGWACNVVPHTKADEIARERVQAAYEKKISLTQRVPIFSE